jgi:hypothetical protein
LIFLKQVSQINVKFVGILFSQNLKYAIQERELWDAASEEEKENLVKPYTFKDQVSKHFKD